MYEQLSSGPNKFVGEVPLGNHYGMCHECVKLYLDLNATTHYRLQCSSPLASWDLLEESHSTDKTGFALSVSGLFLIVFFCDRIV